MRRVRADRERTFELDVPRLRVRAGERLALVGRTGSGKSSLIEVLAVAAAPDALDTFVLTPREGAPVDIGRAWARADDRMLTRARARLFGYVQQVGGLLGFLSVRRNIGLPLEILGRARGDRVASLAEELEIDDLLEAYPGDLSVGQRQRTAIARALVHGPAIVLADEPTAALDLAMAGRVMGLMTAAAERHGTCLILATHDERLAREFGFRFVGAETRVEGRAMRTRFVDAQA
jgi:putative ABC transport system ATP-binding protein